jgi:hypothetical protein
MSSIISLYHGTTHNFTEIDVKCGKPYKDFGQGFYTTQNYDHAKNIAERNRRIGLERLAAYGKTDELSLFVYEYTLEISYLEKINVLQFDKPNVDWVDFVVKNRVDQNLKHGYDLVIGATANDDTRITIQNYLYGAYGERGTTKAVNAFLEQIKAKQLPTQWMFATQKAAHLLRLKQKEQLL